jgi:hypothetical protein
MTSVPFASETMKGEQAYSHSRGASFRAFSLVKTESGFAMAVLNASVSRA